MSVAQSGDLFSRSTRDAAIDELHAATALYTQDPIVVQLLDQIAWPAGHGTLLDTSCGDGASLGRALERLLETHADVSDAELCARLEGWEIHFFAASEARTRLRRVLIDHGRDVSSADALASQMIRCGDFLTEGPRRGQYQAVVGNPPYLRMLNVPEPLRGEYEHLLPDYARADLLHSFLDRCAAILARDGELAMVTADRWLFNESAARVREVVGQHFGLAGVTRLNADSAFYRPKLRRAGTPPRIHPVAVVLKNRAERIQPIGRAPIYPDERRAGVEVAPAHVLNDVAEVRLAPWLGTPGISSMPQCLRSGPLERQCRPSTPTTSRVAYLRLHAAARLSRAPKNRPRRTCLRTWIGSFRACAPAVAPRSAGYRPNRSTASIYRSRRSSSLASRRRSSRCACPPACCPSITISRSFAQAR